ncbi:MAG: alkaline phosphatase D family protein, partial [Micromonosporaceae bacterium]
MARLLLGPVLRWVDPHRATLWLQTDAPCEVTVTAGAGSGRTHTLTAFGHHYALVVVDGLVPGTETPYQVQLDDSPVWPEPGTRFPASRIRTPVPGGPARLVFGSCREASPYTTGNAYPPDALDTYATELAAGDAPWPDYLLLLGDQVYADETSPRTRRFLRRRRRHRDGPAT